jgi:hypothetical protein
VLKLEVISLILFAFAGRQLLRASFHRALCASSCRKARLITSAGEHAGRSQ